MQDQRRRVCRQAQGLPGQAGQRVFDLQRQLQRAAEALGLRHVRGKLRRHRNRQEGRGQVEAEAGKNGLQLGRAVRPASGVPLPTRAPPAGAAQLPHQRLQPMVGAADRLLDENAVALQGGALAGDREPRRIVPSGRKPSRAAA